MAAPPADASRQKVDWYRFWDRSRTALGKAWSWFSAAGCRSGRITSHRCTERFAFGPVSRWESGTPTVPQAEGARRETRSVLTGHHRDACQRKRTPVGRGVPRRFATIVAGAASGHVNLLRHSVAAVVRARGGAFRPACALAAWFRSSGNSICDSRENCQKRRDSCVRPLSNVSPPRRWYEREGRRLVRKVAPPTICAPSKSSRRLIRMGA